MAQLATTADACSVSSSTNRSVTSFSLPQHRVGRSRGDAPGLGDRSGKNGYLTTGMAETVQCGWIRFLPRPAIVAGETWVCAGLVSISSWRREKLEHADVPGCARWVPRGDAAHVRR